jgi:uncharacterized protein
MFFPVSGVEVNLLILPIVVLAVSFFTSMGGISGGFLLLPFQVSVLQVSRPTMLLYQSVLTDDTIPW